MDSKRDGNVISNHNEAVPKVYWKIKRLSSNNSNDEEVIGNDNPCRRMLSTKQAGSPIAHKVDINPLKENRRLGFVKIEHLYRQQNLKDKDNIAAMVLSELSNSSNVRNNAISKKCTIKVNRMTNENVIKRPNLRNSTVYTL